MAYQRFGTAENRWGPFRVERPVRLKPHHKARAKTNDGLSSHGYSQQELRCALVGDTDYEMRGNVKLTPPHRPGDVALSLLGRWRA